MSSSDDSSHEAFELHHVPQKQETHETDDLVTESQTQSQTSVKNTTSSSSSERKDNDVTLAVLFNYHEYTVDEYSDEIGGVPYKHVSDQQDGTGSTYSHVLCINHFPSYKTENKRIVRIPRVSDYPIVFSTFIPGTEPSAVTTDFKFVKRSVYNGQWYNDSSTSPLSLYMSPEDFKTIIQRINALSVAATQGHGFLNFIMTFIDCVTFGIWTLLLTQFNYHPYKSIDAFVAKLNSENKTFVDNGITLISPTENGFLSLDFEINAP
ncbi:hypothetical protein ACO0QE_000289 [Hanseniaspora vineae]